MQEQTETTQETPTLFYSFEVVNTKSSRCREQMTRAKIAGKNRKRSVTLAGNRLRPGRSVYFNPQQLEEHAAAIAKLEEYGQIVLRFDGKDISLEQAFDLLNGEKPTAPAFPVSYVNDPNPNMGAGPALLRMMQKRKPVIAEPEAVLEEVETSPTAVALLPTDHPVSEDGTPVAVSEPEVEVDLGDLSFVMTAQRDGMDEGATTDEEQFKATRDKARSLTVKEACQLLQRDQKWVRAKLKDGTFTRDGSKPITIPEDQLTPYLLDKGEE